MYGKIFSFLWQVWNQWLKYRHADPWLKFAGILVVSGAGIIGPGTWLIRLAIGFSLGGVPISIDVSTAPDLITYSGALLVSIGVILGGWRLVGFSKLPTAWFLYLRGLPGMHDQAPIEDLPSKLRWRKVTCSVVVTYDLPTERALDKIEISGKVFAENYLSTNLGDRVTVFAGLAHVPLLYAAGVRFSTQKNVVVMDYDRFEQKWHMLDDLDDGKQFDVTYPEGPVSSELAIAMPLSIGIAESQIPSQLADKVIWIRLKGEGPRRDALSSEVKLNRLVDEVNEVIRNLRSLHQYNHVERIHLFIAAQASTVFRLGSAYQANAYPEILIYQFDGAEGKYTWAISCRDDELRLVKPNYS